MNPLNYLPRPQLPRLASSAWIVDVAIQAMFLGRRTEAYAGLVALAGTRAGETAVDVGSGTGELARLLAQTVGPTGLVVGVEPSEAAVDVARDRAVPGCRFEVGSALHLPVADGEADLLISSLLIHHIEPAERHAALIEARRVLRPGGRLFIADLKRLDHGLANAAAGAVVPCFRAALTEDELRNLVVGAGFRLERAGEYWGRLRYVAAVRD
ncbi:MAG: class I SAM-dependent methyltransferase [Austwickia sp.]|nr:class I SAM-dependent methyltransferase [Austwickia sp.]MBK8437485.1 class I SAM-dependent methyltransferase [Austwickia sp.]MBK9102750.1 class I SAM-dependent methyltransferase [Austwickia sp.]